MKVSYFDEKLNKSEKELEFSSKEVNLNLVLQSLRVIFFNNRTARAVTKTKAEVRGGGRKPWRQKGTGRARTGSIRSPHWVGGGVSHGPRNINWSLNLSKKMAKRAFRDALLIKANNKALSVVNFENIKAPKVKDIIKILSAVTDAKNVLILTNNEPVIYKSVKNLPKVNTLDITKANTKDIITAGAVLVSDKAVSNLENRIK